MSNENLTSPSIVAINHVKVTHDEGSVSYEITTSVNDTAVDIIKDGITVLTAMTSNEGKVSYTEPRMIRDTEMNIGFQFRVQLPNQPETRTEPAYRGEYPAYVRQVLPLTILKYHPVTETAGQLHLASTDSESITELKVEFNSTLLGIARRDGDHFVIAIDKARLDIADVFTLRVVDVRPNETRRFNPSETIVFNTTDLSGYQRPILAGTVLIEQLTHEIQNEVDVVVRVKTNLNTTSMQLYINHVLVKTDNTSDEGWISAIIPRRATGLQTAPVVNKVYVRETDKQATRSETKTFTYQSRVLAPIPPDHTPPPSAGGTITKKYLFEEDTTGRNKKNYITGEFHTITVNNRTPQNVIIPGYAPYFRHSLQVIDRATGLPLQENIDYTCEWPVMAAFDKTEGLTPIYGGIQFINNEITGQFEIRYQTIGGRWALDGIKVAQALANQANDPKTTTFDQILGRPIKLPPLDHVHSINDFKSFNDVVRAIDLMTETIRLGIREDRESHPGYETLIDEYFRVLEELKAIRAQLNSTAEEINNSLLAQLNALRASLEALKRDVDDTLRLKLDEINRALENMRVQFNAMKDNLLGELEKLRRELTQQVESARNELTVIVNEAKNDLESKFNQLRNNVQSQLTQFNQDLRELIKQTKEELNQSITQLQSNLSEAERRLGQEDTRLNALISGLTQRLAGDEFVKTAGEQTISGVKTFAAAMKFKQVNGTDTVTTEVKPTQFEMNYAGRIIRFLKDGSAVYFGDKRFLFEEDLNPITQNINTTKNELKQSIDGNGLKIQTIETRLSGNEFIKAAGEQTVNGKKTFTSGFKIGSNAYTANVETTSSSLDISVPGNSSSTNTLRLQQDGKLYWANHVVLTDVDKTELTQKDTELSQNVQSLRQDLTQLQQKVNGLDGKYVLKAGDTMTGQLVVPSIKIGGASGYVISKRDNMPQNMGPGLEVNGYFKAHDIYTGSE